MTGGTDAQVQFFVGNCCPFSAGHHEPGVVWKDYPGFKESAGQEAVKYIYTHVFQFLSSPSI